MSSLVKNYDLPSSKLFDFPFLLTLLNFPFSKLNDDLPLLLKHLNYPKSTLHFVAPHQWPTFLALIHCLVQIAKTPSTATCTSSTRGRRHRGPRLLHQGESPPHKRLPPRTTSSPRVVALLKSRQIPSGSGPRPR
ncbi:hypothetical protein JHK82_033835 [Glycine max]|nr:hypothetical protein JHK85_034550 [Glycine max]KAG4986227.1 hypothetical protein JHK86_033918 [Glycine max]KAG5119415.1 hypothetical protein JHK82_033835 [Glycine max]KAG5140407.1 hypothetical protein JHK84_034175 [Glycine max]